MTRFKDDPGQKIHPTQIMWQVMEVAMNAWIFYTLLSKGLTPILILWSVFEVVMNTWILVTMGKIKFSRIKEEEKDDKFDRVIWTVESRERCDCRCSC